MPGIDPVTDVVLQLWRRGFVVVRSPRPGMVRLIDRHGTPASLGNVPDLAPDLLATKPGLLRRLAKPQGWPRGVPLPPWWPELAPGFRILRARRGPCNRCHYPALVLWEPAEGPPRWACPACGQRH